MVELNHHSLLCLHGVVLNFTCFTFTFTALVFNSAPHMSSVNDILLLGAKFGPLKCHMGVHYLTLFYNLN
jgi:hypothetical protein